MNSCMPKVLHETLGMPMLQHVIDAVTPLKPAKTVIVIGNGADEVRKSVEAEHPVFVIQEKLLGTGNALAIAGKELQKGTVLVLNGDGPLITTGTLKNLLKRHKQSGNTLSFLCFTDDSMTGYGRIVRDGNGRVVAIVEDKHATPSEKRRYTELNGGVYVIETAALGCLDSIRKNSDSGEYYLTDIVNIVSGTGKRLEAYTCSSEEILGVNTREDLYRANEIMKRRVISKWMKRGVTFIDPDRTMVHVPVSIGRDTIIYPDTYLEGNTTIGRSCIIYPGVRICDSTIGEGVIIKDNTLIEESRIGNRSVVGPFAHLRPLSVIGRDAKIGNFVEIKKSVIGHGSKASHLTYLGDAQVGSKVNIGAGTITCNYDGKKKFKTVVESGVFIGSDSQLVAPVTIRKNAYVAAGATITKDVPPHSLAISRTKQENLKNWAKKRQLKDKATNRKG